jgi:transposase InsO family protein
MRALGLNGIRRAKGIRTTIPGKDGRRAGDLLNRDFTAAAPNRTWVMDFTYCRTWAGFVYVVVRRRRVRPEDRRLARRDLQGRRPGDDAAADGDLAARARGTPRSNGTS